MTEFDLKKYLEVHFPKEDECCEWKEFKNLKHYISGNEADDVVSYVSAISNMQGGDLIIGVHDQDQEIIGIQNFHNYTPDNLKYKLLQECTNLASEGLNIRSFETSDSRKVVWIIHIPKHQYRLPVYAHKKAWQRAGDSLIEITDSRRQAILHEIEANEDWTAEVIPEASLSDLDPKAIEKARIEFIKRNPKYSVEINQWDDIKFLNKAKLTRKGAITRTAMILLGKEEEEYLLGSTVKIR